MLPSASLQLSGRIWRLLPASDGHHVAVELRDEAGKYANYVVLSLPSLQALAAPFAGPHTWWCGISALGGGRLYLHGYATPEMPQPLGVFAYSYAGQPLWAQPAAAFEGLGPAGVEVRLKGHIAAVLDPTTGKELHLPGPLQPYPPPTVHLPTRIPEGSDTEKAVQRELAAVYTLPQIIPPFHLWQGGGSTVIWFRVSDLSELLVFQSGQLLFSSTFEASQNPAKEPFAILGRTLVFTPGAGDIVAVALPPQP